MLDEGPLRVQALSGPWAGLHMTAVSAAALPSGVFLVLWEAEMLPGPLKCPRLQPAEG